MDGRRRKGGGDRPGNWNNPIKWLHNIVSKLVAMVLLSEGNASSGAHEWGNKVFEAAIDVNNCLGQI